MSSTRDSARREDGFGLGCKTGVRCVSGPACVLAEVVLGFTCRFALALILDLDAGAAASRRVVDFARFFPLGSTCGGGADLGCEAGLAGFAFTSLVRGPLGGGAGVGREAGAFRFA